MLAENICSQSVLSRIESDEEIPNVVVMKELCNRLGVSVDEILDQNSNNIQKSVEWMNVMSNLFLNQRFKELLTVVEDDQVVSDLYLDADLQKYCYYAGSCWYYLDKDYSRALQILQMGLHYTYNSNKTKVSDMEVQLISCIGKVLTEAGQTDKGLFYLKKSMELFYSLPNERVHFELTKVFYNSASFYLNSGNLCEANELASKGIEWAVSRHSFYYLAELFSIKNHFYEKINQMDKAEKYRSMEAMLRNIAKKKNIKNNEK